MTKDDLIEKMARSIVLPKHYDLLPRDIERETARKMLQVVLDNIDEVVEIGYIAIDDSQPDGHGSFLANLKQAAILKPGFLLKGAEHDGRVCLDKQDLTKLKRLECFEMILKKKLKIWNINGE